MRRWRSWTPREADARLYGPANLAHRSRQPLDGDERARLGHGWLQRADRGGYENHLIVAHEVTNVGNDRSQLANMAEQAKAALQADTLEAVADRGYFDGEEILACDEVGITVTLPKPMTSGSK